jgi:hypothetical protein
MSTVADNRRLSVGANESVLVDEGLECWRGV